MKKQILAAVAAVALFSSGVYAGGNFQEISVSFDAVKKIVIFGQDKTPVDTKAFIYNNTTYVPLRYISEQLKIPVNWDGGTGTVYIGESAVRQETGAVSLFNQPLYSTFRMYLYRIDNKLDAAFNVDTDASQGFPQTFTMRLMLDPNHFKATAYESGMAMKVYDGSSAFYYTLGGKYKTLNGFFGFDTEMNNGDYRNLNVTVYGDGQVFKTYTIDSQKRADTIALDVSGVKTLSIEVESPDDDEYEPIINFTNMNLE